MDIKDLETVLLFFYDNRNKYHYFNDITPNFKEYSLTDLEIQAAIQKLVKDGYIIEEEHLHTVKSAKDNTIKEQNKEWGWFISYDGIFLVDTLPKDLARHPYIYLTNIEKKKKRAAAIENVPKKYWWLYNPITFILALLIGYFMGGPKSGQSNTTNSTKTQVPQHTPKRNEISSKPLPSTDTQKIVKDAY